QTPVAAADQVTAAADAALRRALPSVGTVDIVVAPAR
ncbi:MAG: cation transporter, partial [Cellulosimicrobium sp.]|nr:cation transporter [Cellulosimicrobium sp.]